MPCSRPLKGFRSKRVNPKTGKRSIVFNRREGFTDMPVEFACGNCMRCRIDRSRQWAIRCVHEASLYENNMFLTLTYSPKFLPADGSLNLKHFQDFMKRFRKYASSHDIDGKIIPVKWQKHLASPEIRFFHCGEYGEKFDRPHYHACIFNYDFKDKELYKSKRGIRLYKSETLKALWPWGFSTIGDVTFESAAYVARYIMKKITGELAEGWYNGKKPEYITMSRGGRSWNGKNLGGIARQWFEKFKSDVFPSDEVIFKGKVLTPPKFYGRLLEAESEKEFRKIINRRKSKALARSDDNTPERLEAKEQLACSKLRLLKRGYENA